MKHLNGNHLSPESFQAKFSSPDQEVASVDHTPGQSSAWGVLRPASLSSTLKSEITISVYKKSTFTVCEKYGVESMASGKYTDG